ncbi:PD-(D/E)XK nuclease family transposase [Acididesulfobacillus acetoxydans]|nr:PD-(D/E)XK nuclease family transposase [Acididesulfobacillus acetoxydans]
MGINSDNYGRSSGERASEGESLSGAFSVSPRNSLQTLKKCITINIVDFKCTPLRKLYSSCPLTEDETGCRLTDIIEVHFLEMSKLMDSEILSKDEKVGDPSK